MDVHWMERQGIVDVHWMERQSSRGRALDGETE